MVDAVQSPEDKSQYERVKDILDHALDLQPAERRSYVEEVCGDDADLQREVESLLASDEEMDEQFIATPALPRFDQVEDLEANRQYVGPYRLLERLGAGGMGVVYLAERDVEFRQRVALKLIMRGLENDEIVSRFRSERQILASLQHPNIAGLLDGGTTDDGLPYFVMEYVEGQPISRYCVDHGLSIDQRIDLFHKVGEAVAFAHRNLIVHRDIKPANILVTAEGIPKLLDFGIAKLLNAEGGDFKTGLLRPLTTEYASPEQLAYGNVTTASDIYTLGILLYELLTGRRPFAEKETNPQLLLDTTRDTLPPPPSQASGIDDSRLRRRLAGDLDAIVLKALRVEPEERYPSVEKLLDDLDRHRLELPVLAHRGSLTYRMGKFVRRQAALLIIGAISLGLLVAVGFASLEGRRANQEQLAKEREQKQAEAIENFMIGVFEEANPDQSDVSAQAKFEASGEILAQAEKVSAVTSSDYPLQRAMIVGALGRIYRRRGDLDKALRLLKESEALRRQELGDDHPGLVVVMNNQSLALRSLGRYPEALATQRETLRLIRLDGEASPSKIGTALHNLAGIESELGDYPAAVESFQESFAFKRQAVEAAAEESAEASSKAVVSLARGHSNLATALDASGDPEAADEQFRLALELMAPLEGFEQRRAIILRGYGALKRSRGELESATWMLQESLEIGREFYQDDNPQMIKILREVALLNQAKGEHALAEDGLRQVLRAQVQLYQTRRHPEVARTLRALGNSLVQQQDPAARDVLEEARSQLLEFLPPDHPDLAQLEERIERLDLSR